MEPATARGRVSPPRSDVARTERPDGGKRGINIPLKVAALCAAHYYAAAVSSCLTSGLDWDFSPEVKDPLTGFKALAYRQMPVCNL